MSAARSRPELHRLCDRFLDRLAVARQHAGAGENVEAFLGRQPPERFLDLDRLRHLLVQPFRHRHVEP
jgi:hypothetical protein